MLDNIAAFKFIVKKVTAKSKLSQNREEEDFDSVTLAMDEIGKPVLAKAMRRIKNRQAILIYIARTKSEVARSMLDKFFNKNITVICSWDR